MENLKIELPHSDSFGSESGIFDGYKKKGTADRENQKYFAVEVLPELCICAIIFLIYVFIKE